MSRRDIDCVHQCELGWLPVDGERDEADGVRLLIPFTWTICSCADTGNLPEGTQFNE